MTTLFEDLDHHPPGTLVHGIDEAGRGCLAGPVVVCRVSWRPHQVLRGSAFAGLGDSKKLSGSTREKLFPLILEQAEVVRVAVVSNLVVDVINILRAALHGFEQVAPPFHPDEPLYLDGNHRPPTLPHGQTVIKGDGRISAVAAASIIAKVFRDRLMLEAAEMIPGYLFEQHKGYATASHRRQIAERGPSFLHRKTFRGVCEHLDGKQVLERQWVLLCADASPQEAYGFLMRHYGAIGIAATCEGVNVLHQKGFAVLPTPATLFPELPNAPSNLS